MGTKRKLISYTQIQLISKCEEAWRRRYVENDRIPPLMAQLRGSSVHHGAHINFKQKVKSRRDLKPKKVIAASVSAFEDRVKHEGYLLNRDEEKIGRKKVVAGTKDQTARLTGLFCEEVAPVHQPLITEKEQIIPINNSDRDLIVKLDLINDREQITDLKTGGRRHSQYDLDHDLQSDIYTLGYYATYKKMPKGIVREVLVDNGKGKLAHQQLKSKRFKNTLRPVINRINAYLHISTRIRETGVAMPTNPTNWWCSKKWCGYYATCPYVKGVK